MIINFQTWHTSSCIFHGGESLSFSLSHIHRVITPRGAESVTERTKTFRESVLEKSSLKTLAAMVQEWEREKKWRATSSYFLLQPSSAKSRDLETNSLFHAFLMSDAAEWALGTRGNFPAAVYIMSSARRHSGHLGKRAPRRGVAGPEFVVLCFPKWILCAICSTAAGAVVNYEWEFWASGSIQKWNCSLARGSWNFSWTSRVYKL